VRTRRGYRSKHGGLWTDRVDAERVLAQRVAAREVSQEDAERLRFWMEHGYVILPGAVPHDVIDRVNADVDDLWRREDASYVIELGGVVSALTPKLREQRYKLVDLYTRSEAARQAAFAEKLVAFLRVIFERDVLLFQSLSFERGSGDPVHQDSAYVVVTSPLEFAAAWIALEDIRPGSGELEYYPGSHRLAEHHFAGAYRNWNPERDGVDPRTRYLAGLHERSRANGLELARFLPKKGDVLVWSADLAHGGSEIRDPGLSRRSLVCHYCPRDVKPYYMSISRDRRGVKSAGGGCWYSSSHYAL
jgi:hypothetical protein